MKRIFLAIKAHLNDYEALQSDLAGVIKGRWTREENLHITVCYFGDAFEVDVLLEKLPSVVKQIEPLSLTSL